MDKNRKIIITLIIVITVLVILLAGVVIYFTVIEEKKSNKQPSTNINNNNYLPTNESENTNSILDDTKEIEIQSFNATFEIYEGTEMTSGQIQNLFSTIQTNNTTRTDGHIVNIDTTGITLETQLDATKKYNVELFKDSEGYVNIIKITEFTDTEPIESGENQNTTSSIEQVIFNSKFTPYVGQITGTKLAELVQAILDNNNTNAEHQIAYTSNNLQEISQFLDTDNYIVTLKYDSAGYINIINIDKVM